jgi:predicted dienelactone hydrolase
MTRRPTLSVIALLAFGVSAVAVLAAGLQAYKKEPGARAVAVVRYDWLDTARNRPVPVKIYYPEKGEGPFPVIVFSHGLGGSREGYEYLGRHWASHGYVVAHVQHQGSDDQVWKNHERPFRELELAVKDTRNAIARPLDVRFALDQLAILSRQPGPLQNRLNLKATGIAGHSFGGWTTLAVAGQVFPAGTESDPRFKAAIAMSASVELRGDPDRSYGRIRIPILHMTGTLDDSPIGETKAGQRRIPFDHIHSADQYLVIFEGGDHMVFAGQRLGGHVDAKDPLFHALIFESTTAFWDAYLKQDAVAKKWLAGGGFRDEMGANGKLEVKEAAGKL